MNFLDQARALGAQGVYDTRPHADLRAARPNPAVQARFGAGDLEGVTTLTPMTVAAAESLKTALAFGQVQPGVVNPLVMAFQTAYNQSPERTQHLAEDGKWGPNTERALAQYDAAPTSLHANVPYTPDAPGPVQLRRGGVAPPPAVPPTPGATAASSPLVTMARALSPQAGYDAIFAFQTAWNASGAPWQKVDGLWGPNTAKAVRQVLGQPAPPAMPPAYHPSPAPTFVSPPANEPSVPRSGGETSAPDVRPWIVAGTAALAAGLLAWAPWKRGAASDERAAPTVRARKRTA